MNIIAAVDKNWGIGKAGQLLLSLPSDMRFFKTVTTGNTVVMGRKTFESLPGKRPLSERNNIVLSKTLEQQDGITVVQSISQLFTLDTDFEKAFVIGGAEIYQALLPYCEFAFVTKLNAEFEADTYFPNLDETDGWEEADVIYEFTEKDVHASIVKYFNTKPQMRTRE